MFCNSTYSEHDANSKIEDELSIQIFDRTKNKSAYDIGHKIVVQAKNIVNEADRIQDIVEQKSILYLR
jgi:LysR family hydrogen peroxide-inducible transcriptional activator